MPKILHVKLPLQTRLTWSKSHLLVVEKRATFSVVSQLNPNTHTCLYTDTLIHVQSPMV